MLAKFAGVYGDKSAGDLVNKLEERFEVRPLQGPNDHERMEKYSEFSSTGFKSNFREPPGVDGGSPNQVHHYTGIMSSAYNVGLTAYYSGQSAAMAYAAALGAANIHERNTPDASAQPDKNLNTVAVAHGIQLAFGTLKPKDLGESIKKDVCGQ